MKKIIFCSLMIFLSAFLPVNAEENQVLKSESKEALLIDETKMQEEELNIDIKEFKTKKQIKEEKKASKLAEKKEKKAERDRIREQKKELKKTAKKDTQTQEIKTEQPQIQEDEVASPIKQVLDDNVKPPVEEETKEAETPAVQTMPELYRKNLTFEDIDKNAVSINEFLLFSRKQNEKFSLFYYKTVSKINLYNKQIEVREGLLKEVRAGNMSEKGQYEKLKKAEREIETLMRERDTFYNKALQRFNSMLTKKQAIKWQLLQQMGYRFLPEIE